MNPLILVALGGVVGAVLRYLISTSVQSGFPYGTLFVNFTGTVALGAVMYLSESYAGLTPEARIFLTIGVLGAYTTMSTFGYESFRLLEQGDNVRFALNVLGTNSLSSPASGSAGSSHRGLAFRDEPVTRDVEPEFLGEVACHAYPVARAVLGDAWRVEDVQRPVGVGGGVAE